jgi:N-acetyl-anhydromuramyl-L-alanine amidase AmpD
MELAKQYILPDLTWQIFGLEAMLKTLKASRANCIVDAGKLQKKLLEYGYKVKDGREALVELFEIMKEKRLQYCR